MTGATAATSSLRLAAAAAELLRARDALEVELARGAGAEDGQRKSLYRLRDLALASLDLVRELLRVSGVEVGDDARSVVEGMARLVPGDREVLAALETLAGLTNAHVLAVLPRPPEKPLRDGRAAGVVVAAFLDTLLGDGYVPRGG